VLILTLKKEHRGDTISTEHVSWILFGKIKGCFYLFLCDGKMWKNAQKNAHETLTVAAWICWV